MRADAGLLQGAQHFVRQLVVAEVEGRAVHRHAQVVKALGAQAGQVPAGAAQHPGVEFGDETIGLGDAYEAVRREQAELRVLPAHQGFQLGHLAAVEVEDGLVVENQALVLGQGQVQFLFQLQLEGGLVLQVPAEEVQVVAAAALGLVEREVGVLEQFLAGFAIVGVEADADAGGHGDVAPAQGDGFFHALHDPPGQRPGLRQVAEARQYAELVAAQACDHVLATQHAAHALGHHLEQLVAGVVAEAVVDALEVVDVEEHHGQRLLELGVVEQFFAEVVVEGAAIGQVGQGVVVGDVLQLHLHLLQFPQQVVDVPQVALLALQLLVGPGHAEGAEQHHAGDHRQAETQLQGVVGALQAQFGAHRHGHLQGEHAGEVHAADGAAHGQAGGDLEQLVAFAAFTEEGRKEQGGQAGGDGDADRHDDDTGVVVLGRHRADGRHAAVVHGGDAEADGQGRREVMARLDARPAEGVHGDQRSRYHDHQGKGGGGDVVVDGDRGLEGEHGDEVHRPDTAPQTAGAQPAPAPSRFRLLGMGHPFGHVEGAVAGARSDQEGQQHQPTVMGTGQEHLVIRRKFTNETQAQPIHRGVPMQRVRLREAVFCWHSAISIASLGGAPWTSVPGR
ncbi:hypothetical protein D9M68_445570 [compost metagenome]